MENPIISDNRPKKIALQQGENYYFCACGLSKNQSFCDGSHAATNIKPKAFAAEESGDNWLCQCKYSQNTPYCDGTHKQFSDEQVGKESPEAVSNKATTPVAKATRQARRRYRRQPSKTWQVLLTTNVLPTG